MNQQGSYSPYSPPSALDPVKPISLKYVDDHALGDGLGSNLNKSDGGKLECFARFMSKVEAVKNYMADHCCSFLNNVPNGAFLTGSVAAIVILIVVPIAIIFLLFSPAVEETGPMMIVLRQQSKWPSVDPAYQLRSLQSLIPPNVTLCKGYGFACTNIPSIVIGTLQRCDGNPDCPDGSDEMYCKVCQTTLNCTNAKNTGSRHHFTCLRGSNMCDGRSDCADGSDEKHYCRKECKRNEVRCNDSKVCVSAEQVCDGDKQCTNGDDEKKCAGLCRGGALWCKEKSICIPRWKFCDGKPDCPSGIDEKHCTCKECSGTNKALCNNTNVCIERTQVCDGHQDCPNGDDEVNCPGSCSGSKKVSSKEMIKCADGVQYHQKYACSGILKDCASKCTKCNKEVAFQCANSVCIARNLVCNGKNDCSDKSDEINCNCADGKRQCKSFAQGGIAKCIPKAWFCDGYDDCPGGDDELNCDRCASSNSNGVYCNVTKRCLVSSKRCNGVMDCPNGLDEQHCTCKECSMHPQMYMCGNGQQCFPRSKVCRPFSQCQRATEKDKLFCASFVRQSQLVSSTKSDDADYGGNKKTS